MEEKKSKNYIKKLILILLFLILLICSILLYARYISTKGIEIKEYRIKNQNITENFHGLKIVHISDINYKTTINKTDLCKIVDKINITKPDLVVLTGDFFNQNIKYSQTDIQDIIECMSKINATLGKYAISGDQDYSYENYNTFLENIGFNNLNDTYDFIYKDDKNYILLSGISSIKNKDKSLEEKLAPINEALNNENKAIYNILLIHEPDLIDSIEFHSFNTILAGHSLNGQVIIPFIGGIIIPENAKKYYKEYYNLDSTNLYISGGIGTTNINFRFFNKPSFNLYRITKN